MEGGGQRLEMFLSLIVLMEARPSQEVTDGVIGIDLNSRLCSDLMRTHVAVSRRSV